MRKARERPEAPADTGTLGKAMAILDLVAASDVPLRFTDILHLSNQPRGTLYRQISHLVDEGLLSLGADLRYEPGIRLLKLASNAWARNSFRIVAEPHLRKLHEKTGETAHLGILHGEQVIYLDKVEGRQAVRMASQIGNASPVYCTGVGKAAISALADDALKALIGRITFRRFTANTLLSGEALLEEVQNIRHRGHAFDMEEHEEGIRCVAAPIFSKRHDIAAGLSVTGPAYRVSMAQLEGWAAFVEAASGAVMQDLEALLGPGR